MCIFFVFCPAALFGGILEMGLVKLTRPKTYRPGMKIKKKKG